MRTDHLTDQLLQRHLDGDLEPALEGEVRAHLLGCEQCTAHERALTRLHDLVVMTAEDAAGAADFSGLYERIEAGIEADREAAKIVTAKVVTAKIVTANKVVPLRSFTRYMPFAAALAVAAAVLLMVALPQTTKLGRTGETPDHTTDAPYGSKAPGASPHPDPTHSEVVQVDFGSNAGTVFDIAMADGSSTPVVWINDE